MRNHIIRQIVEKTFEKAKKNCPSDAHTTLSNYIEAQSKPRISYKTAVRAYKKYIEKEETDWSPNSESIKNFCKYLGYEGFKDYVEKNEKYKPKFEDSNRKEESILKFVKEDDDNPKGGDNANKNRKWIYIMTIILSSITVFFLYDYLRISDDKKEYKKPVSECMSWAKDHYEKIDCGFQLHPDYGTKVDPYDVSRSKMRKIEVNASFDFFSEETGQPLVWYYKTKKGTLEYFNLPGLHPVNGETLKKITEGMIKKYVPIHSTKPDSFISNNNTNSIKTDIAILVLDGNGFDDQLTSALKTSYFSKKSSIVRLKDLVNYDKNYISNFNPSKELFLNTEVIKADTLVLGVTNYDFHEDKDTEGMIICNLQFEFTLHTLNNKKWKEILTKSINSIGSGFSKTEAKTNAIKKINYE